MSKFLVTGGAGFIGSHIVEQLLEDGHFVGVLDNFSSGKKENLSFTRNLSPKTFVLSKGDIRDKDTCLKATKGVDFVLHQAALRSVPKSLNNPKIYNEVNIQGTLNMLEASRDNKVKCFVLASSSSIYGEALSFPEKEDDATHLISPYALTKLVGEYYCKIFAKHYSLNCVSLRYFNVFGERQSSDDEYSVVIPKFISCLLDNTPPPIHGTGRQSRDFTYIDNVVQANIMVTKKRNLAGEVFNIAGGKDFSILSLVKILNEIVGKNIKPVFLPKRPADVFRTQADLSKAKRLLGFSPRVDFVQGLKLTVEYFKKDRLNG